VSAGSALRLFIALWPPTVVRRALQAWQAQWAWPSGATVVAPESMHVTLHFLGSVPVARVDALRVALLAPVEWLEPFDLSLDRVERWPHGLVVLSPRSPPEPMRQLQGRLAVALSGIGVPVEARAFRPHVTLARRAAGAEGPPPPVGLCWRVRGYALVQSADGYHTLQRYGPGAGTRDTRP
jgi:2'-5' RNA ligase